MSYLQEFIEICVYAFIVSNMLALGTGSRNFPAALILVGPRADTPGVTVMVLAALVVNLIALLVLARVLRRR